jgi:hypothetical protein
VDRPGEFEDGDGLRRGRLGEAVRADEFRHRRRVEVAEVDAGASQARGGLVAEGAAEKVRR